MPAPYVKAVAAPLDEYAIFLGGAVQVESPDPGGLYVVDQASVVPALPALETIM